MLRDDTPLCLSAGTIVELMLKNGTFITTSVTYCGLPQHRGFHPTGAIAVSCGKLTVRCSPMTYEQLRDSVRVGCAQVWCWPAPLPLPHAPPSASMY